MTDHMALQYWLTILGLGMCQGMAAAAIAVAWGRCGLFILGPALFFGLGSYMQPLTSLSWMSSVFASILLANIASIFIGFAILRFPKGILNLAAFTMIGSLIAERLAVLCYSWTNGSNGLLLNHQSGPFADVLPNAYGRFLATIEFAAISISFLSYITAKEKSFHFAEVARDAPDFLVANGISIGHVRTIYLCIATTVITVSGMLYSGHSGIASPEHFGVNTSMRLLAIAIIAKMNPIAAFVAGTIIRVAEAELGGYFSGLNNLFVAITLIIGALYYGSSRSNLETK